MCGVSLSLQTFLLDGNSLEELPGELGSLQRLSYVGLSFNQLNHVPQVLEQLASMEKLCMAGNNLETLTLQNFRLLRVKHIDLRYHSRRIKKEKRNTLCSDTENTCHVLSPVMPDGSDAPGDTCFPTNDRNKNSRRKGRGRAGRQTARIQEIICLQWLRRVFSLCLLKHRAGVTCTIPPVNT